VCLLQITALMFRSGRSKLLRLIALCWWCIGAARLAALRCISILGADVWKTLGSITGGCGAADWNLGSMLRMYSRMKSCPSGTCSLFFFNRRFDFRLRLVEFQWFLMAFSGQPREEPCYCWLVFSIGFVSSNKHDIVLLHPYFIFCDKLVICKNA
jgi:hypothetical protein